MKERVITAICLLAVVLPLIYLGGYWLMGLILIAASIAAWEMMAMYETWERIPILNKMLTLMGVLSVLFVPDVYYSVLFALFISLVNLIYSRRSDSHDESLSNSKRKTVLSRFRFFIMTLFYIGFSFRALLEIRNHSLTLFIFLIAIVILTDSAAYFAGRFFGKHKLAPKISPKKTVEGAIGGWLAGAGFAVAFGLTNHLFTETWVLITLAVGLPILSQIGDLVASAMKRKYGIKDYGKIFPGHGGVMDRVDSQMLAAILIYVIIQIGGV